jgi:hypothetical protein
MPDDDLYAEAVRERDALRARLAELERRAEQRAPLTREELEKMTPAEINARWPEVRALLDGRREPLTADELAGMTNEEIGRLDRRVINESWPTVRAELERRGRAGKGDAE